MTKSFKFLAVVGATLALQLGGAAFAQSEKTLDLPPQETMKDGNDVNLLNATYEPERVEVSVGAAGKEFALNRAGLESVWGHNMLYDIAASDPYTITLRLGTESKVFDRPLPLNGPNDGVFRTKNFDGSTLVETTSGLVYTARDGTVVVFVSGNASQVTYPSGKIITFTYKTYGNNRRRLQSVNTNEGQQLKFTYPSTSSGVIASVSAINNAVDYCAPTADPCGALSQAWPTVSFSTATNALGGETVTKTDPSGNTWVYTTEADVEGNQTANSLRRPTESQDNIRVTYRTVLSVDRGDFTKISSAYTFKPVKVKSVIRPGQVWNYAFGKPTGIGLKWRAIVTDPLTRLRTVQVQGVVTGDSRIFIDPLNRSARYELDPYGRYYASKAPELDTANAMLDDRGNATELRLMAKPGAALADKVATASYATTCSNFKICNKPNSLTDANDGVTDYTYDPTHGGLLTETAPAPTLGGVRPQKRYSYSQHYAWYKNSSGAVVQAATPIWLLTQISECRSGAAPACIGTADETRTTLSYGVPGVANNLYVTQSTVAAGDNSLSATTSWTYDAIGNKLTEDGPQAGSADTTRWRYDAQRRVIGEVAPDPDGAGPLKFRATRTTYDAIGRLIKVEQGTVNSQSDPDWLAFSAIQTAETKYDALDRKTHAWSYGATGGLQSLVQYSYDLVGRLECTAVRMNPTLFVAPNFSGLPTSACTLGTQGAGADDHGPDRITKLTYDAAGQVIKTTLAFGTADQADDTTNSYTNNGKLQTVTDAENNRTTFEYDGHDRLKKTRYPVAALGALSSSTTDYEELTYDDNDNVIVHRKRDGQLVNFTYDALNRATFKDVPNLVGGELDVTTSFDNLGRPTNITDTNNNFVGSSFDALGRMTAQTSPFGSIGMQYDVASRLTRVTHPDAVFFTYGYNTSDLTSIKEGTATNLVTYTTDDLGRRTAMTRGNGTVTNIAYDPVGRLKSYAQDLGGTANDLTVNGPGSGGTAITYNPASQLTGITRTNPTDIYAWTGHYNINRAYGTNGLNQLTSAGATALGYDGRGNLTSSGSSLYTYTSENRLATAPGGMKLTYDPTGRLSRLTQGGVTLNQFEHLGPRLIAERNASGNILRRYVHGPGDDEPVVWYEGSSLANKRFLHTDERRSVIAVTDATGASIATNKYDEYGIPQSSVALAPGTSGRFLYTGQMWIPELGLYYYKARFYSPTLGRFMQTDPIGYKDGINWYAYVDNDPINRKDPTGLYSCAKGAEKQCNAVDQAIAKVRVFLKENPRAKNAVQIRAAIDTYGERGKANGLVVMAGETGRAAATTSTLQGVTTITINGGITSYKQLSDASMGSAEGLVIHEGQHAVDSRWQLGDSRFGSQKRYDTERRAYTNATAYDQAAGTVAKGSAPLWGPGVSSAEQRERIISKAWNASGDPDERDAGVRAW